MKPSERSGDDQGDRRGPLTIDMNKLLDSKLSLEAFEIALRHLYGCRVDVDELAGLLRRGKITSESMFNKFLASLRDTLVDKFGFNELKANFEPKFVANMLAAVKFDSAKNSQDEKIGFLAQMLDKILRAPSKEKPIVFNRSAHAYMQDCQIKCNGDQEINAHKCILIAR